MTPAKEKAGGKHVGHEQHHHGGKEVSDRGLIWAVLLNIGLSAFEVAAGIWSGSVALLADALHNFNDCAALFITYVARRISRRGANAQYTFSYRRAELIGAMINLTALIVVGLYLLYEAVRRLVQPQEIDGGWMMAAAGVALVVDVATAWLLWALSKGSLNVRAAFVHNLTDALASLAVVAGGVAVYFLEWNWVDPVLTLAIAGYILFLSSRMLRRTAHILMEGAPEDVKLSEVGEALGAVSGVVDVHHVHVWELDEEHRALEAHLRLAAAQLPQLERIKREAKRCLEERFHIQHSTLEFEVEGQSACAEEGLIPRQ